jgi:hypothetical protein
MNLVKYFQVSCKNPKHLLRKGKKEKKTWMEQSGWLTKWAERRDKLEKMSTKAIIIIFNKHNDFVWSNPMC